MSMTPWLSQVEVDDLCEPLKQSAAQIRYMREQGLTVRTKPNGTPLVMRNHLEQVMNSIGKTKPAGKREPDRAALASRWSVA